MRNEEDHIEASLGAVLDQVGLIQPPEVIVVDGCSDDRTVEIAEATARLRGVHLTVLSNPRRTAPTALNLGLAQATGDIIVRIDGHCQVPSDYLAACLALLEQTGADCVGGLCIANPTTKMGRAIAAAMGSPWGMGGVAFRRNDVQAGPVDTLAFGAYRREVFECIGGFDEELVRNQDDEFNFRLVQSGGRIWLDPRLRIGYSAREELGALARQFEGYGRYKVRVMQKRGALPQARHLAPGLLVGGLLGLTATGFVTRRPALGPAAVMAYLLSLTAAVGATGHGDTSTIPTVAAAATMHIAYGFGWIRGLWVWRDRFGEPSSGPFEVQLGWQK